MFHEFINIYHVYLHSSAALKLVNTKLYTTWYLIRSTYLIIDALCQEHSFSRLRHSKNYVIQNSSGKVSPSKMIPRRLVLHSLGFLPILFNNPLIAEALEMKEPDVLRYVIYEVFLTRLSQMFHLLLPLFICNFCFNWHGSIQVPEAW